MSVSFTTPDWVKNAVFYQIFPDRFAKSSRIEKPANLEAWEAPPSVYGFKGGDLLGIVERLDYLQDLGINAIYLNPIFQSASNHRYHTHDYYRVDPMLGGDRAFHELIKAAHARDIRIVLDGVFNHASRGFFQFNHILECGPQSPYIDWFDIKGFPLNAYQGKPDYGCWENLPALPEFNTRNRQVREFIFDVARYWIEQGADGWRLDVPFCIKDDSFWQEFRQVVKTVNPEAYLVGEIPMEAQHWLQGDQFDGVMNYQFMQMCLGFFGGEHINRRIEENVMGLPPTPVLDATGFAHRAEELLKIYPQQAVSAQLNLLDSHDMPRFLSLVSGDKRAFRLATLFLMTYPGAPCVYYGDEIGLTSGEECRPEGARWAFPWDRLDRWDADLREYFRTCIHLRLSHPALRTGSFHTLHARAGIYAYLRRSEDETLVVVLNNRETSYHLDIPTAELLPDGAYLNSLTSAGAARVVKGRITHLAITPKTGAVLQG